MEYLNLEKWNRKDQFFFFQDFDNPFFNMCTDLDVTNLHRFVKKQSKSFFIASLFCSIKVANEIPEFRFRIRGDEVVIHEKIHAGSTVLNEDETFGFCYFDYFSDFHQFEINAKKKLKEYSLQPGMKANDHRDDLIHHSIIPWISFTSFSHARKFKHRDSIPKIVFGKYYSLGDLKKMPVSVEVHHSLMDGIHVGKYYDLFQHYLNTLEE